ncbi:hypothetical protein SLEP1_g47740 [Rubroshorea leprosula]|uniref:Uncharacterized protein n=1 Tax=Rubroshorea leprosula TaxID=152421 RepID=A0AAV5LSG2_9ROSI|nr:hypothetical protein SLEP1_g47740 [Rubroshorea leprosula]
MKEVSKPGQCTEHCEPQVLAAIGVVAIRIAVAFLLVRALVVPIALKGPASHLPLDVRELFLFLAVALLSRSVACIESISIVRGKTEE